MRPIHLLLGLVVILASGASAFLGTRLATSCEQVPVDSIATAPTVVTDESSQLRARAAEDKLAMLAARLDAVTDELEAMRNSANREPAAAPDAPALAAATNVVITPEQRQTVLAVLAEERAREASEAEARRLQAEKEGAQRRAARVAKELNLAPGDETRLADLMFEGGQKRLVMMETMRNGSGDRENMRSEWEALSKWQSDQYTLAFGASIAEQILETEGGRIAFGGPGGPGGGGGGGRGARRANAAGGAAGSGAPAGGGGQQQN